MHTEKKEAQTLLVPMASNGLGEKPESAALLNKHALGMSLVSRVEFDFQERSCQKLFFTYSEMGPRCVSP